MESIKLRTMTAKSVFADGKYRGWTVQKLLDLKYLSYLEFLYFNMEKVSFTEDVLAQLRFKERIQKPGIDKEIYKAFKKDKINVFQIGENESYEKIHNRVKAKFANGMIPTSVDLGKLKTMKAKRNDLNAKKDLTFSKGSLQSKNHGH